MSPQKKPKKLPRSNKKSQYKRELVNLTGVPGKATKKKNEADKDTSKPLFLGALIIVGIIILATVIVINQFIGPLNVPTQTFTNTFTGTYAPTVTSTLTPTGTSTLTSTPTLITPIIISTITSTTIEVIVDNISLHCDPQLRAPYALIDLKIISDKPPYIYETQIDQSPIQGPKILNEDKLTIRVYENKVTSIRIKSINKLLNDWEWESAISIPITGIVCSIYRTPSVPNTLVTPSTSNTPVTPNTPTTPNTPVTPNTPTTPNTPVTPNTPTTPNTPVTPNTPTTPNPPTPSKPKESQDGIDNDGDNLIDSADPGCRRPTDNNEKN